MDERERYEQRVKRAFEDFIVSKFIEYQPYLINDDCIINDAKNRSIVNYDGGLLQWMQSFASIYTIAGEQDMEYNGNRFKQILLKSKDDKIIRINYSDFQYYTSFYKGKEDSSRFGFEFDDSNAHFVNTLDDKLITSEAIAGDKETQILIGYNFNTVNKYGSLRKCYRLYSLSDNVVLDAKKIREQILRAQAFSLLIAAKYPVLCIPSYNRERLCPYMYEITKEIGSQYSAIIRAKLCEVEKVLREHGLTYECDI